MDNQHKGLYGFLIFDSFLDHKFGSLLDVIKKWDERDANRH